MSSARRLAVVVALPALVTGLIGTASSSGPARLDGLWLTGDTHVHTDHSSDGSGPRQVMQQRGPGSTSIRTQIAAAERRGLDFLPITDHRTYDQHWSPEWTSDRLLLIPGEEANGSPHANVLGAVDQVVDGANPDGSPAYRHVQQSIWDVHAQGAVWQTNHPDDGEVGPDGLPNANASAVGVDTVEVLNSDSPEAKLDYVENRWNAGWRFGIVGASDSHFSEVDALQGPGLPATRLLARARTERDVLDALRAGRTALTRGNGAPVATLTADTDGDGEADAVGGDERRVRAGDEVTLTVRVERGTGYDVLVYGSPGRSAGPVATFRPTLPDQSFELPVTVRPGHSWYRVEVRGPVGTAGVLNPPTYDPVRQLQAATSPVFLSTSSLAEPDAELPLPATTGSDEARVVHGEVGSYSGFADVAASGPVSHVVAEQHAPGRTAVVYRNVVGRSGPAVDLAPDSAAARFPRVAARGEQVAVVWQDERGGQTPRRADVYLRTSSDGGRTWAPEQRLTDGTSRSERPVVGLLPGGIPVVAWQDNRQGAFEVLVQRIGVDAAPVDLSRAGKTVAPANPVDARSARYPASVLPSLAVSPTGAVSVGWQDNRSDPDPLFTGSMQRPDGTAPDDWEVLVATLPAGAAGWSAPASASADSAASDRHPALLYDAAGRLHVAWDTKELRAAGVNVSLRTTSSGDGVSFAPPVALAVEPAAMSQRPRLGLDRDGGVRAVWYDTRAADWRWKVFSAVLRDGSWTAPVQLSGAGNGTWPAVAGGAVVFTTDRHAVRVQRDPTHQVALLRP